MTTSMNIPSGPDGYVEYVFPSNIELELSLDARRHTLLQDYEYTKKVLVSLIRRENQTGFLNAHLATRASQSLSHFWDAWTEWFVKLPNYNMLDRLVGHFKREMPVRVPARLAWHLLDPEVQEGNTFLKAIRPQLFALTEKKPEPAYKFSSIYGEEMWDWVFGSDGLGLNPKDTADIEAVRESVQDFLDRLDFENERM